MYTLEMLSHNAVEKEVGLCVSEMNMLWPKINPKIKVKAELPEDETVSETKGHSVRKKPLLQKQYYRLHHA